MKKLLHILTFLLPLTIWCQDIVQKNKYDGKNNRFEKAIVDAVFKNVVTGKEQLIKPPFGWVVKDFDKIKLIDTTEVLLSELQHRTLYKLEDSTNVTFTKKRAIKRTKEFTLSNLEYLHGDFSGVENYTGGITKDSFYATTILTQQNRVINISVNGITQDYNSSFNAVLQANGYRNVKKISNLQPNTKYKVKILYESEQGDVVESIFYVKTKEN